MPILPVGDEPVSGPQYPYFRPREATSRQSMLHDYWYKLVEDYTTRNITKSSDRLPAIAGLAKRVSKQLPKDTYVSGLWLSDIRNGLLWKAGGVGHDPTRAIASSWSWAAPNERVRFEGLWFDNFGSYGEHRAPTFTIPSDVDKIVSPFPLLQAQGSFMLVKCALEKYPRSYYLENCDGRLNHGKPPRNCKPGKEGISAHYLFAWWDWSIDMRSGCYDGVFHCLIFGTDHYDAGRKWPRGLILKCVDPEKRLYKRMGVFDHHNCDDWLDETLWEELIALKRETIYIM
ncbi:hypothetical protein E8E13_008134 [Curvularia kusanoi]|uniref:Uncharacterized protein n=1 Tax=Curvularia kusanoi TaxID=90978 RepID=A0A9P4TD63_CURKU|nr:hypothetical protein E8E13_008134 [Curvularia kusanoi]